MREKLIELILNTPKKEIAFVGRSCGKTYQTAGNIADHLLANGVIVPPCKVGDIIYAITYDRKDYMPLKVTSRESLVRWMDEDQFGNTLFATREEAERALRKEDEGK